VAAGEGLFVLGGVDLVLLAVDGDGSGQLDERADERVLPQGALGQEARVDRQGAQEKERIDQAVDVVRHQDHGPAQGQMLSAGDLDAAEEDADDETQERLKQGVDGGSHAGSHSTAPGPETPDG
jgi:hypothetical protein